MKEFFIISNQIFQYKLESLKNSIRGSNQVAEIITKHLSQRPFHLNVIEAACNGRFKETGHSLVLAKMLRHPTIQSSFLKTFLNIHHEYMKVTAEKDRIDVTLKGDDIIVIIENKINAASEQKSQVYRYVHDIGIGKYGYNISQIFVVYLNPVDHTLPSEYSLCDENKEHNVFYEIGEKHFIIKSYKHDITDWLRGIYIDNEPHISSALDQYIDFLEHKFHISPLDKIMNKEIKNLILKELQIENKSFEEQIEVINNQRDKVNELLNAIDNLKDDLRKEQSNKMISDWKKQIEQQLGITLFCDNHSFSIQLKNKVRLGIWDGYDSKGYLPYWGFQFNSFRKDSMPELYDQIKKLINSAEINNFKTEENWIAWCTTQKGIERFTSLYHSAKKFGLL